MLVKGRNYLVSFVDFTGLFTADQIMWNTSEMFVCLIIYCEGYIRTQNMVFHEKKVTYMITCPLLVKTFKENYKSTYQSCCMVQSATHSDQRTISHLITPEVFTILKILNTSLLF